MPSKPDASVFKGIRKDATNGGYAKTLVDGGQRITFRILAETKHELEELLPEAEKFWRTRARWFKAFREYAAEELLDMLHGNLDYGQKSPPVFTPAQIRKLLVAPFSVVLGRVDDGSIYFEMSGGKGRTLRQHCFEVSGTIDEGITDGDVVALF